MEIPQHILLACKKGDAKSQKLLYDLLVRKMFGVCMRFTRDYSEAEDVLQEGFLKVFQNLKYFDNKGSFEGWVRKIMVNTSLEKFRKQNFLYPVSDISEYDEVDNISDTLSGMTEKELLQMVQALPPQYKTVFNLYAIEGYNHQEIAKLLGISEGTSKSNLSRARGLLQQMVKKYMSWQNMKEIG